jgi:hypothetical protein
MTARRSLSFVQDNPFDDGHPDAKRRSAAMSSEMELLDQLEGGSLPYPLMEQHVFDGDRAQALRSIEKMQQDGLVVLAIGGRQVEGWRLSAWRRSPEDSATIASLAQAVLSLTDLGVNRQ